MTSRNRPHSEHGPLITLKMSGVVPNRRLIFTTCQPLFPRGFVTIPGNLHAFITPKTRLLKHRNPSSLAKISPLTLKSTSPGKPSLKTSSWENFPHFLQMNLLYCGKGSNAAGVSKWINQFERFWSYSQKMNSFTEIMTVPLLSHAAHLEKA